MQKSFSKNYSFTNPVKSFTLVRRFPNSVLKAEFILNDTSGGEVRP